MIDKKKIPGEISKEQADAAIMIENLSQDILKSLKKGSSDVDIQLLMDAIEAYASYPNYHEASVKRWKERIGEITKLLELQYIKVQDQLKEMMANNPKIAAYNKATSVEEEE